VQFGRTQSTLTPHDTRMRVRIHAKKRWGGSLASRAREKRGTIERARVYPKFYGKISFSADQGD